MKKSSYIVVGFVILIFGIYAVPKIVKKMNPEKLAVISEVPDFEFTNQNGEKISKSFYKGKVYVVEFFFTSCPTICPKMTRNMVKIQQEFYGNPTIGIASFTINPKKDTPEILKEYAKKHGASHKNWNFLTGDREKIYELANRGFTLYAGVNEKAAGGFEHSGMFALVDKNGKIRSRYDEHGNPIAFYNGLDDKLIEQIKDDIKILLKE